MCLDGEKNDRVAFQARADYQNHAIGWLHRGYSSLGGGKVVRFPRIWMVYGECRYNNNLTDWGKLMARIIAILALVPLLGACATIVEGTSQEFIVNVSPDSAYCQLTRKGVPISSINGGKNLITLEKSRNDIIFDCTAPGYEQELIKIESSATGWGVVGCIFIDLCITDYSTGALNSYADSVNISLKRKGQGDAVLGNATLAPPLDATWRSISISSNPPQASCQLINNGRVVGYVQTPGAIQIKLSSTSQVEFWTG